MKDDANEKRREFLKKAGKFAIYTPPALMMLMHPSTKAIAKSGGGLMPRPENGRRDINSRLDNAISRLQSRMDSIRRR